MATEELLTDTGPFVEVEKKQVDQTLFRFIRNRDGELVVCWDKGDPLDPRPAYKEMTIAVDDDAMVEIKSHYVAFDADRPVTWNEQCLCVTNSSKGNSRINRTLGMGDGEVLELWQAACRITQVYSTYKELPPTSQEKYSRMIRDVCPVPAADDSKWERMRRVLR